MLTTVKPDCSALPTNSWSSRLLPTPACPRMAIPVPDSINSDTRSRAASRPTRGHCIHARVYPNTKLWRRANE